jgi:hypothetical protein
VDIRSPEEFLAFVLHAIAPYLSSVVIVGGFAVWLYRSHPRAAHTEIIPLRTYDVDIAAPPELRIVGGQRLTKLMEAAAFEARLLGRHTLPVMRFVPKRERFHSEEGPPDAYGVEFLTPLIGSGADRTGNVVATKEIQKGVTAQCLRYLDLLREEPWQIALAALPGIQARMDQGIRVQVPHPGLFIVQKILISGEPGRREKRAKDMAYIYEVLALFRRDISLLVQEVKRTLGKARSRQRWLQRFERSANELFRTPRAPGVTEAHAILASAAVGTEAPTPEMIHAAVHTFLRDF